MRLPLLIVLLIIAGCGSTSTPRTSTPPIASASANPAVPTASPQLEYFGKQWTRDQEFHEFIRKGWLYTCDGDPTLRLVFLDRAVLENQYIAIIKTQVRVGDRWIHHGKDCAWAIDGDYSESNYFLGEPNGEDFVWNKDGQLTHRRSYLNGQAHGRSQVWYDSGARQSDSVYEMGKEVSGEAWREDGSSYANRSTDDAPSE